MRSVNDQAWKERSEARVRRIYNATRRLCLLKQAAFFPALLLFGILFGIPGGLLWLLGTVFAFIGRVFLAFVYISWDWHKSLSGTLRGPGIALREIKFGKSYTWAETRESSRWEGKAKPRTPWGRQRENLETLEPVMTESETQENQIS